VDDGSTDDTRQKLGRYGSRLHYIYQENKGLSAARNAGLAAAEGEFIQLVDSDDLLHSRSVEYRLEKLKSSRDYSWVVGPNCYFSTKKPAAIFPAIVRPQWGLHSMDLDARLFQSNIAPPHAFLSRRELFEDVGGFDTSLRACEDYDYWVRALSKGYTPIYSPRGLVYYRRHSNSMSQNQTQQWQHDVIMHRRVVQILSLDRYREHTIGNVLKRLCCVLGIRKTLNRAKLSEEDTITQLLCMCEAQLEAVKESVSVIGLMRDDLRIFCVLYQIFDEEQKYTAGNERKLSSALREISERVVGNMDASDLRSQFYHRYLFNGEANFKTTLDYMRWTSKGRVWIKSMNRGCGDS
jgi:GT2 family glycosyltransferase